MKRFPRVNCAVTACLLVSVLPAACAFLDIIARDYQALTRKVTAHHILLPRSDDVALALKQSLRNQIAPSKDSAASPAYIVDAFSAAATRYSRDEDTAARGGLLGTLVPQGYCRAPELDAACFQVPLGEICGPIKTEYGYHLLLVVERTNCPKLDGPYTRITRGADGTSKVFEGKTKGEEGDQAAQFALQQVGFWAGVTLAGGVLAEVAAKAADVIDKVS